MADHNRDLIVAAMGMMGASTSLGDAEAITAFRTASRLLEKAGLSWHDVATRAFPEDAPSVRERDRTASRPSRGFTDIFDDLIDGAFSTAGFGGSTRSAPRTRRRIGGRSVPETIRGRPEPSGGHAAPPVFDVVGDEDTYGPLVCLAASVEADLRRAAAQRRRVLLKVRPPTSPGHLPVVLRVTA